MKRKRGDGEERISEVTPRKSSVNSKEEEKMHPKLWNNFRKIFPCVNLQNKFEYPIIHSTKYHP